MTTFIILAIVLLVVTTMLKEKGVKGWLGEKITSTGMWALLDNGTYRRIDDVIVPGSTGTTQIDHVVVSPYGIFVVETKNIKGWIFGDPENDKWTQSLYGKKSQFQNPVKQNYRHTRCLAEYLHLDHELLKPVVFFIGDCEFKTSMPSNVLNGGIIPYMKAFRRECLSLAEVNRIESSLKALKRDKSLNHEAHLTSLRQRHESTIVCPRCGGSLVQRIGKRGKLAGKLFLGCSNYPKCRYTRS